MKAVIRVVGVLIVLVSAMTVAGCGNSATAKNETPAKSVKLVTLHVTGMTCTSCEEAIQGTVGKIPGVQECSASHEKEQVIVKMTDASAEDEVKKAIDGLGYKVEEAPAQGG